MAATIGRSLRRVAVVQHEVVAVRIGEGRHVTDARVERLAGELDALGFELRARRRHVVDMKGRVGALLGRERHACGSAGRGRAG
jgi:hypothetical protein